MANKQVTLIAELAIAADGGLPTEIRFFRAGTNRTTNGVYLFTKESAVSVMEHAKEWGNQYPFDWVHSMLSAKYAADPRKAGAAAGYFDLEVRESLDGPELWAINCEWNEDGADDLKKKRFKYCSPTFSVKEDGTVIEIVNCALTALPATHNADPLVASRDDDQPEVKKDAPLMKTVLQMLSLKENATEVEAAMELSKLQQDTKTILAAAECSSVAEVVGKVTGWKQLTAQNAELSKRLGEAEIESKKAAVAKLIDLGVKEGKVSPAELEVLTAMGEKDVEMLKACLSVKPKVLPGQSVAPAQAGGTTVALSKEELEICRVSGENPADYAKKIAAHKAKYGELNFDFQKTAAV